LLTLSGSSQSYFLSLDTGKPDVRAYISSIQDGTYIRDNRTVSNDYDLVVYDPDGRFVASSRSHSDPFDGVSFTVTRSGSHEFRIERFAQQNAGMVTDVGLGVHYAD